MNGKSLPMRGFGSGKWTLSSGTPERTLAPSPLLAANDVSSMMMPARRALNLVPLPVPAQHPVAAALARLSTRNSQLTALVCLRRAARLLSGGRADPFLLPWPEVRYTHLLALRTALLSLHLAPATINGTILAVRAVLTECWRAGSYQGDELQRIRDVPRVRAQRLAAGRMLGVPELRALARTARADAIATRGARDLAALGLLYGVGLRLAEAAGLPRAGVGRAVVRVIGKGNKEALLPLAPRADALLRPWLALRGEAAGPFLWALYRTGVLRAGVALTPSGLYQAVAMLAQRAGVRPFTPHDLRRSFGSHLLDRGVPIREVQELMRHASVTTTQRYDRRPLRDLARHAVRLPF